MMLFKRKFILGRVGWIFALSIIESPTPIEYRARLYYAGFHRGPVAGRVTFRRAYEVIATCKPFCPCKSTISCMLRSAGVTG